MAELAIQSEASEKSTEFKAKIIKYTSEENAPILASSDEDIHLIFKIPKEIFRKLAVAAIAHLDHSGTEKAIISNGDEKSENGGKSKFRLSTNDNIHSYEDCNECDMSKNKDYDNSKTCVNGSSSHSSEFSGESVPMCEAEKQTVEEKYNSLISQTSSLTQASNIESVQQSSDDKCNKQKHSDVMDNADEKHPLQNEKNDNVKKMDCKKDENGHKTQGSENHAVENCRESDKDCVEALSANLSGSSPESDDTWPNIQPFAETEKIPITEIKSLELQGILTKYLKLELSNEFVVIKVTSESEVLVDAVKYKEMKKCSKETEGNSEISKENEHNDLYLKESDCSIRDTDDISVETLTADSNATTNSITETALFVNEDDGNEEDLSCPSKPECGEVKTSEKLEPENNLKKELESITQSDVVLDSSSKKGTETEDFRNSSKLKLEDKDAFIVDERSEIESADDTERESPHKLLGEAQFGQINLKIEKKLEELETNVSGCSPSERLEFCLNDTLKNVSSETTAKQIGTAPNISGNLSVSDAKENYLQIKEKFLEDSVDECVTESSEVHNCNEINVCHETKSSNIEYRAEIKFLGTDPEHESISPQKVPIDSYLNADESESMNQDSEVEKAKSDHDFEIDTGVKMQNGDSFKLADEKDSLEDSALGRELNFSESDSLNDCSVPKDTEYKKTCSEDMAETIPCVNEENENSVASNNSNAVNGILNEESNKQCEDAIEETNFHTDVANDSTKSNFENSLSENITEEKYASENTRIEASAENYETNELKHLSNEESKDTAKEELKRIKEMLIADKSDEETLYEVSDLQEERNEADTSNFENSLLKDSKCLENSISETVDLEKHPESSFASNLDSFLDSTIDANTESTSESGDLESDDVKSIASESDDSKDGGKRATLRRKNSKGKAIDEVDCAPTRVRTRKMPGLSEYAIPENIEVKSSKQSLDTPSKYYERKSPPARSTRSKSLDPAPQQTKRNLYGKNGRIVEAEEQTRKTRAKTPDIISKKDIKTTARSSPRKLTKSAATGSVDVNVSVANSKSRANRTKQPH